MAEPKAVVAVGICACTGGIFSKCYNIYGGVDSVIPVDVYVPGCAARPEAIIDGVVKALEVFEGKRKAATALGKSLDQTLPQPATGKAIAEPATPNRLAPPSRGCACKHA
jgi:NADH:ubiquinone oxidoreductase subunit B-like Fe-S oxidoreductase